MAVGVSCFLKCAVSCSDMRPALCVIEVKMAANNSIVADAVLEYKLADLWPDYPCPYDVRCPEFKNRELREKAFQELAEKHGKDACAFALIPELIAQNARTL